MLLSKNIVSGENKNACDLLFLFYNTEYLKWTELIQSNIVIILDSDSLQDRV